MQAGEAGTAEKKNSWHLEIWVILPNNLYASYVNICARYKVSVIKPVATCVQR